VTSGSSPEASSNQFDRTVEVFADITCPFTHVGLSRVATLLADSGASVDLRVRAWPLEWVNGTPLEAAAVAVKAAALREGLDIDQFTGLDTDHWPCTTIPALNLAASARQAGSAIGLAVSRELRDALFERGTDIADLAALAEMASRHGLPVPAAEPSQSVLDDYAEGKSRGVRGSPDFFIGNDEFFCPALDLGHDESGNLTAQFDMRGLEAFMAKLIDETPPR